MSADSSQGFTCQPSSWAFAGFCVTQPWQRRTPSPQSMEQLAISQCLDLWSWDRFFRWCSVEGAPLPQRSQHSSARNFTRARQERSVKADHQRRQGD